MTRQELNKTHSSTDSTDLLKLRAEQAPKGSDQSAPPKLKTTVVTCMDARIDLERIFNLKSGEVHTLRNAGGIATDDIIRSLMLSQHLLGTQEVMVIQHTNCGLDNLAEADFKAKLKSNFDTDIPWPLGSFTDLEKNVVETVKKLKASPLLLHRDKIRGFIYDVKTGILREVTK